MKFTAALLLSFLLLLMLPACAAAQGCAMCSKTAQSLNAVSAKGLNTGIIYLAFLPLGIISTLGLVWYRAQRTKG